MTVAEKAAYNRFINLMVEIFEEYGANIKDNTDNVIEARADEGSSLYFYVYK